MKTRNRRKRKGFTLTEVLLVMAILVMIAGMAVVGILQAQKRAYRDAVATEINTFETACTQYRLGVGRFPSSLRDLFQPPNGISREQWGGPYMTKGDIYDVWGNEYLYQADEENLEVYIASPGPDGQQGTEDDITNNPNANPNVNSNASS